MRENLHLSLFFTNIWVIILRMKGYIIGMEKGYIIFREL